MYPEVWRVSPESYLRWAIDRDQLLASQPVVSEGPLISIVMPVYNTDLAFLSTAIDSVRAQRYPHWQLCIADDASPEAEVAALLRRYAQLDDRICVVYLDTNQGIAGASNRALELADGDYIGLMDHDDVLHPAALNVVASALGDTPHAKFVYTDSDHLDGEGRRCNPFFKPGWDYTRFLGQNYLNHFTVIHRDVMHACEGWRIGYEGSQDYDLYLRIFEQVSAEEILHIPEVLYHWRDVPSSVARSNLGKAVQAAREAIRHHFERGEIEAQVRGCPHAIIFNRVDWPLPADDITVISYGDSPELLEQSQRHLQDLLGSTASRVRSLRCVSSSTLLDAVVEVLNTDVTGYLCVVDARLRPANEEWLGCLVSLVSRSGVALATGKLLGEDGRLAVGPQYGEQKSGTGQGQWFEREDSKGYIAGLCLEQEVAAVDPGVWVASLEVLREQRHCVESSDSCAALVAGLSQCLLERNQKIVWSPHARLQYVTADDSQGSTNTREGIDRYGDVIPGRLPKNPNCQQVEWEVVWKDGED